MGSDCDTVIQGVPVPRNYVAEMVMDRISASRGISGKKPTRDRAPYEYYRKGKDHLWFVHEQTKAQLEMLLGMLAEKGEKETLRYIKTYIF